ncbi:MAG: hypothetical protein E6Q83_02950 [Thiothrix sp.]|nr:MAG: hypothetical protein E6Q83_02950 [Thiothrix sp.]
MKNKFSKLFGHSYFSLVIALILLVSITALVGIAIFSLLNFSASPLYPAGSAITEEQSFEEYVRFVSLTFEFMTTLIGLLIAALVLTLILFAVQMYAWSRDKRRLALWREQGLVVERLEFLTGNRLRLNQLELELNRAQMQTLRELVIKRQAELPLHPADLPGDNGTQLIKRLREELGARLLEKSLIQNRRGKGYWLDMEATHIHVLDDETEAH